MFWSIGHFRLDFQKLSCSKQDQVQNLLIEFFNNINQKKTELSYLSGPLLGTWKTNWLTADWRAPSNDPRSLFVKVNPNQFPFSF